MIRKKIFSPFIGNMILRMAHTIVERKKKITTIHAYLAKQCAALTSQRSLMMEAPHKCLPWNLRLTCHGSSPCRASSPPTTRLPMAGRVPQAEKDHMGLGGANE